MTTTPGAGDPDHWRWREGPVEGTAVVVDIDGVLADATSRQHYVTTPGRKKDWRRFFEAAGDDPLVAEVARLLDLLDPGLVVVLLTARPVRIREATLAWLGRHEVRWDLLVMRRDGDFTPAVRFKRDTVDQLRAAGLDLQLAFEDDRKNVAMFHEAGVPCVYVHSGYYEEPQGAVATLREQSPGSES